jgi:hypothetical protein
MADFMQIVLCIIVTVITMMVESGGVLSLNQQHEHDRFWKAC